MPVHPQVQALLEEFDKQNLPPVEKLSPTEARLVTLGFRDLQGEPENIASVRNIIVPGPAGALPVRLYYPSTDKPLPLLIYFHGGGWVIGDIEVVDRPCRALANASNCITASVNYRLSPETKFPGAVEDCYAATRWLAENAASIGADNRFIAVAGDSAGGNLAAVVSLMARDRSGPTLAYQVLVYPVTSFAPDASFRSYEENAEGYLLTKASMEWFRDHYLSSPDDSRNPYASPLLASDLSRLPPAMVITMEFDPLRDEGLAYAQRLKEAGVRVRTSHHEGMIHGILWMAGVLDGGKALIAEIGAELCEQTTA